MPRHRCLRGAQRLAALGGGVILCGVVTLGTWLAGCATVGTAGAFTCPARGGPAWRDVASPNFVLRTDLEEGPAQRLLERLELIRASVLSTLFDEVPAPGAAVEVVVFASEAQYRAFAPPGVDAYYLRSTGGPPRIVLAGDLGAAQRAMLGHELTHHFLASIFLRQPRWLAEGLATQLESLGEPGSDGLVRVGLPPTGRLVRFRQAEHRVPVRELLGWDGGPGPHQPLDYYASAWLLVHFLTTRHQAQFGELERRLIAGEAPAAAWRAAFPAWDPALPRALEGLDGLLVNYAGLEVEQRFRQVGRPWQGQPVVRPIPPAEVHALRLTLWSQGPDKGRAALRAEVAEALAEDPDHPLALEARAGLEHLDPEPLARRAVEHHPDDPRAWTFLGLALKSRGHDPDQMIAAYRRAAVLAAENPAALHNLAAELLALGRSGEALPAAREAAALAPWSPPVLDGYAAVLADLGRCEEAIPVQQRALDVLPERSGEAARQELLARLEGYQRRCQVKLGR